MLTLSKEAEIVLRPIINNRSYCGNCGQKLKKMKLARAVLNADGSLWSYACGEECAEQIIKEDDI